MINSAVIGRGSSAKHHAELLGTGQIRGARLAAVCDVQHDRAEAFRATYDAPAFGSIQEMLAMPGIDTVAVPTPGGMRGETFVTRKITRAMARIALGLQDCLYLGNMSALRDWGHAKDYVEMQWLMLQQDQPEDFVIATGVQYSVRQFVEFAAEELGISMAFEGQGDNEVGVVTKVVHINGVLRAACEPGDVIVKVDPRYFRPTEVETLLGDPSKAKQKLGWAPKIALPELVKEMVEADYTSAKRDSLVKAAGYQAYDHHE